MTKVAHRYADVLFENALHEQMAQQILEELGTLVEILTESEIKQYFNARIVPMAQKRQLVTDIFSPNRPEILNLLLMLIKNEHMSLLPQIYQVYQAQVYDFHNQRKVRVLTAFQLEEDQRQRLKTALADYLGFDVVLEETLEPELIQGLVIKVGDVILDKTLRKSLDDLENYLRKGEPHVAQS